MGGLKELFVPVFGKPNPKVPNAIHIEEPYRRSRLWAINQKDVGAGWFMNRFLYLFGSGLERLIPCLEEWSFLIPPSDDRIILGRNAYGALLILDDPQSEQGQLGVLDPFQLVYWTHANMNFENLLGLWLPKKMIPGFLDTKLYDAWIKKRGSYLEDDFILAPTLPAGLGGEMEASNFQEEEIVTFYETRGPTYAKTFAKMGRKKPKKKSK